MELLSFQLCQPGTYRTPNTRGLGGVSTFRRVLKTEGFLN